TLRDVTAEYEGFRFNTMVAHLMELANTLYRYRGSAVAGGGAWDEAMRLMLLMLAPAAPHITEELWSRRLAAHGNSWSSIHTAAAGRWATRQRTSRRSDRWRRSGTGPDGRTRAPRRWHSQSGPAPLTRAARRGDGRCGLIRRRGRAAAGVPSPTSDSRGGATPDRAPARGRRCRRRHAARRGRPAGAR